jgi:hypothetical protein
MTYRELQDALAVFGLSGRASLREIKKRQRELAKSCHPDVAAQGDPERIRIVNAACAVLLGYAEDFRFSFTEEEFLEQNPEERLRLQFGEDPLWGNK